MMDWNNIVKLHSSREINDLSRFRFQRKLHVTKNLVMRLGLEAQLEGHMGCVNCLEWNERGDLLASGSDDRHIILWDPFSHKKLQTIETGHHANLFSVKFLPNSSDSTVMSCAADYRVKVHDVYMKKTTMSCSCHGSRVKRLAVTPSIPYMFWSAAEDGMIMEHDLRVPHECTNICNNVIIHLVCHLGANAEAKCIAINPLKPELLAVGANDPYVRLYDRRMITKPTNVKYSNDRVASPLWIDIWEDGVEVGENNLPPGCVTYFAAGHLPLKRTDFKRRYRTLTSTYVTFSPDGNDLLVNLGGEHIYLFNILSKRKKLSFDMMDCTKPKEVTSDLDANCPLDEHVSSEKGSTNCPIEPLGDSLHKWRGLPLEDRLEMLQKRATAYADKLQYTSAIFMYNTIIQHCPQFACLYDNRAAILFKRGWDGDIYAAVRDCYTAIKLDPGYLKAHFRLAKCLHKLYWFKEALECLTVIRLKFPDYAKTQAFESFETDVKVACFAEIDAEEADTEDEEESSASALITEEIYNRRSKSIAKALLAPLSDQEKAWRAAAYDYEARFWGHCNTTTDIKEANFFGSNGQFIVAGSDDGSFFIWDRVTTNIVNIIHGDESIVNCVQPHPNTCMLATSGIDPVVRLWGPRPEKEGREFLDREDVAVLNQRRMNADPLEMMLLNMGYRVPEEMPNVMIEPVEEEVQNEGRTLVQCRTS